MSKKQTSQSKNIPLIISIVTSIIALIALVLSVNAQFSLRGDKFKNDVGIAFNKASLGWIHESTLMGEYLEGKSSDDTDENSKNDEQPNSMTFESEATMQFTNNTNSSLTLYNLKFSWDIDGNKIELVPVFYFLNKDYASQQDFESDTVFTINPGVVLDVNFRLYWYPSAKDSGYQKTIYDDFNKIITDSDLTGKSTSSSKQKQESVDALLKQIDNYFKDSDLKMNIDYDISSNAKHDSISYKVKPTWNHDEKFRDDLLVAMGEESQSTDLDE